MNKKLITGLFLCASINGICHAQESQLQLFSKIGGAITVGETGTMQFVLSRPLAEWKSIFKRGHGTIIGLAGEEEAGLGLGHRFEDYLTEDNRIISFTIGPAYTIPWETEDGLRGGAIKLFVSISFRNKEDE